MRKLMTIIFTIICVLISSNGLAENTYISAAELPSEVADGWHEVYTVNGNTISMDIDVYVPNVSQVPIVRISQYTPMNPPNLTDVRITGNETGRFVAVKPINPLESPSKDIGKSIRVIPLSELSDQVAYAENNELTFGEAKAAAEQLVNQFGFGDCDFDFEHPYDLMGYGMMVGQLRYTDEDDSLGRYTDKVYKEKGFYWLAARQRLYGIPIWKDIRATFRVVRAEATPDIGVVDIGIDAIDGGFNLIVKAASEEERLYEDVPLCSFDKVKAAYEEEIIQGHIRQADQLVFAYVYFRDDNNDFVCYPCWLLRCLYVEDSKSENSNLSNASWKDSEDIAMVVVNAQTGELFDPYDTSKKRDRLPQIITWEKVR